MIQFYENLKSDRTILFELSLTTANMNMLHTLNQLKLLKLRNIYRLELGKFMWQLNTNKFPEIIQSIFLKLDSLHKGDTRYSKITNLFVPRVSKKIAENQLSFRGSKQWMSIHSKLKTLS